MPTGYPNKKPVTVIDVEAHRSGLRGRLDRLAQQLAYDAQAVRRTVELIDKEDRVIALNTFPQKMLTAINGRAILAQHEDAEPEKTARYANAAKKKTKKRGDRKSEAERLQELSDYLTAHPGQNTNEIAAGLGWLKNQVHRFAHRIAIKEEEKQETNGRRIATWFLKTHAPKKNKTAEKKPRTERHEQIRKYLDRHPESYTADIATALKVANNSSFKSILRDVAKPAFPTNATQPIQWVLN